MDKEKKAQIIKDFAIHENDVGSPEVQVALLTERVSHITEHLKNHKHDHATRRGLVKMVNKRRKLLNYLRRKNVQRYKDVIRRLGIRG